MAADPRWEEIKSIAGRAGEFVGRERDEFLRAACREDASLEREIRSLLDAADADESFLVNTASDPARRHFELGEFRLLRELGRGATAIVYLARQERLNREVAVKVLVEGPLTSRSEVERFHREARAVARLRHPGIVRVLSDGQIDGTHWFAMEYVAGHDLARELSTQRARVAGFLPPRGSVGYLAAAARVCAEAAEALHHAHQHGLVHRDVKPQNLLLDSKGTVQVVDFGLARDVHSEKLTRDGDLLGTVIYMSPEQARAQGSVDPRTDVYSLGVVLYELCTDRRPIEGRSLTEHLRRLQDDEPPRPRALVPGLPRDLERICLAALVKDPAQRYPDAGSMAEDLRRFLRDEPVHARPSGLFPRLWRFARRHRKAMLAGGLVGGSSMASLLYQQEVRAGSSGRLSVEFTGANGALHTCPVSVRLIDPVTSMPGSPSALGVSPVESAEVASGYYRVVLECEHFGRREFTREILPGREERVRAQLERLPNRSGMVAIPGGTLSLRDEDAPLVALNGMDVVIEPFLVDVCEVTLGEYARFLEESGHPPPEQWPELHRPDALDLPMVYVTWRDALAYAEWCGKRLPTYAEWNWIARGAEGRRYPWGSEGPIRGNAARPLELPELDGLAAFFAKATRVGSFPEAASPGGVHDLFGNVAEWTESPVAVPESDGFAIRMEVRIYAGHAWDAASWGKRGQSLETFSFGGLDGPDANHRTGFRCVLSL